MFDVSARMSYKSVPRHYRDLMAARPGCPVILLGNKADSRDRRVYQRHTTFHLRRRIRYMDVSARANYCVAEAVAAAVTLALAARGEEGAVDAVRSGVAGALVPSSTRWRGERRAAGAAPVRCPRPRLAVHACPHPAALLPLPLPPAPAPPQGSIGLEGPDEAAVAAIAAEREMGRLYDPAKDMPLPEEDDDDL